MALPTQRYSYQQVSGDESKAYAFDSDTPVSILDPSLLDSEMLQHPGTVRFRKDSFAASHGILTPAESHAWTSQYQDRPAQSIGAFKSESTQYADSMQHLDNPHGLSENVWMAPRSGNGTPTATLGMMPPPSHYDSTHYMQPKPADAQTFEHRQYASIQAEPRYMSTTHVQMPMSARSGGHEYMALAQAEDEARPMSKRLRSDSSPRPITELHRHDGGIQKKNKRIDIPHERNIQTIDQMIETTKDEDLLKELKAQKRLLRNREAALASRQRKKKHTEELESKEKTHQNQLTMLEEQIETLSLQRDELEQQRQILFHHNQEKQHMLESIQMERRDMIMKHTEETASLRRKVQILTEQLESMTAPIMSAAPSSTGFTDFNAEMEALNMGPHDWDNFMFMRDAHVDDATELGYGTPQTELKSSGILDRTPMAQNLVESTSSEQPVASGLLFMLLLCGAFVASKPASTTNLDLPAMPEDVRLAAPTVLSNLLSEANHAGDPVRTVMREPAPLMQATAAHRASNRLTQMHRSLTTPSRQQEIDSAFSLTTSQYASLTNTDLPLHDDCAPRRTLAQTLTDNHLPTSDNKAEIYTRSLLWEHIPRDVVNQFRELVRDHQDLTTHERNPH